MGSGPFIQLWLKNRHALIPALVAVCLSIPGLTQGALATDTAWYSAIAVQAWDAAAAGDPGALWSLPGYAGQPYFNKPPLAFWLNGLPLAFLGPTVAASRLGSIVACVLCAMAISRLGRLIAGRSVGLGAGLVLALTWEFIRHGHAFSLDLWLTLFLTLAACSVASACSTNLPKNLLFTGVWIGLALMVKPLVPLIAFPLLAIWLWSNGHGRWLGWLLAAVIPVLAVAAPWHVAMWLMHGEAFTSQYFGREIIERAAAGPVADFNKGSGSPFYYAGVLLGAYWPWLATFLIAMVAFVRREGRPPVRAALALSLIWCAGWLLLLSVFPDKRPRYLLVVYPIAAIASSVLLTRLAPVRVRVVWAGVCRWALTFAAIASLAISVSPIRIHRPENPQWQALYAWLDEQGSSDIYAGAFAPQRGAQLFLNTGVWPIPTRTIAGEPLTAPVVGGFIVYHRRDGLAPGAGEALVFSDGDLLVSRLDVQPWSPVPTPDPGE